LSIKASTLEAFSEPCRTVTLDKSVSTEQRQFQTQGLQSEKRLNREQPSVCIKVHCLQAENLHVLDLICRPPCSHEQLELCNRNNAVASSS